MPISEPPSRTLSVRGYFQIHSNAEYRTAVELVHNGTIYLGNTANMMQALDGVTGKGKPVRLVVDLLADDALAQLRTAR